MNVIGKIAPIGSNIIYIYIYIYIYGEVGVLYN